MRCRANAQAPVAVAVVRTELLYSYNVHELCTRHRHSGTRTRWHSCGVRSSGAHVTHVSDVCTCSVYEFNSAHPLLLSSQLWPFDTDVFLAHNDRIGQMRLYAQWLESVGTHYIHREHIGEAFTMCNVSIYQCAHSEVGMPGCVCRRWAHCYHLSSANVIRQFDSQLE